MEVNLVNQSPSTRCSPVSSSSWRELFYSPFGVRRLLICDDDGGAFPITPVMANELHYGRPQTRSLNSLTHFGWKIDVI